MKGIEPSSSAWKAVALPLSYTRKHAEGSELRVECPNYVLTLNSQPSTLNIVSIGEYRIRTCEGISHQIYSLTRLTASVTHRATSNSPPSRNAEDRYATAIADGDRNPASADLPISAMALGSRHSLSLQIFTGQRATAPAIRHGHSPWQAHTQSLTRRFSHTSRRYMYELAEGLEPTTC